MNPKVKIVPIASLILDDANPNAHTKRGKESLGKSLEAYGAGRSVLVDKHNRVIAGNATVEQARAAGMKSIAVIEGDGSILVAHQRSDLDLKKDKKARELSIADNRVSELDLEWNPEVLSKMNIDIGKFWNESELRKVLGEFAPAPAEAPEPKMDQAAALQKKWKTARGQIWEIGKHRLMCGDSTDVKAVKALLSGHAPALCVTDPPYGVNYDPAWRQKAAEMGLIGFGATRLGKVENDHQVDWTLAYKLFPGSVLYVWHAGIFATDVARHIFEIGFSIRSQIIWSKSSFAISRGHYHWQHEPCWYAVRDGAKANWIGDRSQSTIWEIAPVGMSHKKDSDPETAHSTQKPLECMARPIRNHEGDVYEPFSGSGTTICAAQTLDRICYAMEIEPKYVAVALERLSDMGLKPKLTK